MFILARHKAMNKGAQNGLTEEGLGYRNKLDRQHPQRRHGSAVAKSNSFG
jgi:hypothetical protein